MDEVIASFLTESSAVWSLKIHFQTFAEMKRNFNLAKTKE